MKIQKCIVTLEDGTRLVYHGPPQYDTVKKPRIRKTSFTEPEDDGIEMPDVADIFNVLGIKK